VADPRLARLDRLTRRPRHLWETRGWLGRAPLWQRVRKIALTDPGVLPSSTSRAWLATATSGRTRFATPRRCAVRARGAGTSCSRSCRTGASSSPWPWPRRRPASCSPSAPSIGESARPPGRWQRSARGSGSRRLGALPRPSARARGPAGSREVSAARARRPSHGSSASSPPRLVIAREREGARLEGARRRMPVRGTMARLRLDLRRRRTAARDHCRRRSICWRL
jgi:hypothetical protein